jgi:nucleotide-binding universal stress UspA family protein
MYRKIVVAHNDSPESQRALISALRLAKSLDAETHVITSRADLPAYAAFAEATDPSLTQELKQDQTVSYNNLQQRARAQFEAHGIEFHGHLLEGHPVEAIVNFLRRQQADLLVIGLHQHDFYIARLWSTVYELAQDAPCSVLGVH